MADNQPLLKKLQLFILSFPAPYLPHAPLSFLSQLSRHTPYPSLSVPVGSFFQPSLQMSPPSIFSSYPKLFHPPRSKLSSSFLSRPSPPELSRNPSLLCFFPAVLFSLFFPLLDSRRSPTLLFRNPKPRLSWFLLKLSRPFLSLRLSWFLAVSYLYSRLPNPGSFCENP